jgi:hypothetical protein
MTLTSKKNENESESKIESDFAKFHHYIEEKIKFSLQM